LDRVSTGSGSDLVNYGVQRFFRNIACSSPNQVAIAPCTDPVQVRHALLRQNDIASDFDDDPPTRSGTDSVRINMGEQATAKVANVATVSAPAKGPVLQRKCACGTHTIGGADCESCRKEKDPRAGSILQRMSSDNGSIADVPPVVHEVLNSSGQPLDPATRNFFEPRFGRDFSHVRVHADAHAAESAQAVSALAYTVGNHIVFGPGRYDSQSPAGRKLLAHELTHTIQQLGMSGWFGGKLEVGGANDFFEQQADWTAERMMHGSAAVPMPAPSLNTVGQLQTFRLQRDPSDYVGLSIEQLRRRAVTDPEAAEALRLRYRAMTNIELERFARNDPMAQSIYADRRVVHPEAEGQGRFTNSGMRDALAEEIQRERLRIERGGGIPRRASSAVEPGGRTQGGTVGAARTDIPGLEGRTFIGRSVVAGGARNPQSPFAPPTDPVALPQTHGHAEQAIADQLAAELRSVPREQLVGRRVWMLIEQTPCPPCAMEEGVLRRLSKAFPEITFEVKSLDNSALMVLRNGAEVAPGAAAPAAAAPASTPTAAPTSVQVGTEIRAISSVRQPNGSTISEIEYIFRDNLDQINRAAPAQGRIPGRMVMRVTTNAEGAITAVESLSGQPQAMAEALVRQTLPRALSGEIAGAEGGIAEGAAAAGSRGMARLATGLRVGGWVAFAVITGYQLATATPAQRPRVAVQAGAGLATGMATGYVVCNVILGIETFGWSLVICGFIAGGAGGYLGSEAAGEVYDEATATDLDRALQDLSRAPRNVRVLFNILVGDGHALNAEFVRRFMATVPYDLRDYELVILAGQLGTATTTAIPAATPQPQPSRTVPPARTSVETVCPNCHRAANERGTGPFRMPEMGDTDRQAIASWIASQPQQAPQQTPATPGDRSHASPGPIPSRPSTSFPSVQEQQGTVCPNCHQGASEQRRFEFPVVDFRSLPPSPTAALDARLETMRMAIGRLPERQRAPGDISHHPPATPATTAQPPARPAAPQGFPTVREQLGTVCPNCHRAAGQTTAPSPLALRPTVTDQDLSHVARWIQSQPPAQPAQPATTSHATPAGVAPPRPAPSFPSAAEQAGPCPNCHQSPTRSQPLSGSLLDRVGSTGAGGQISQDDQRRLLEWIQAVERTP
jgi:hypothetical protein